MKKILTIILLLISYSQYAQLYTATWQSIDTRPVPQWYKDAKFGIFIHWGVYAVPGWCTKGNYAEWYQYGLQTGDTSRINFHRKKFGNLTYYQLADQFKAELFNPDDWAKLIEQSGARYIVLTSKHHDGFCLWPSQDANRTWGFPWNSLDVGPKRDLINDLFKAVRKTSVHAGMYYSLYEWFNPLWKKDPALFASQHTWPQMKELINQYQPDVFWTDGDWDASENVWKSKEFLAWLYNESPVKDKVVTIDRWGSGVRFKHGMVFSPEYQPDVQFEDHYWEESRGMGYSYGYNREEDAWDYNSTQSLIIHLADKVSRGGNFLLDIGPDEHGKIPPIMEERLLQMGEWMNVNGEAIHNTVRWKVPSQWSEGRRDYLAKGGDVMLKLTIDPDPGYAVKEIFYTYNDKSNTLYAIFPRFPDNRKIVLKDIILPAGTKVAFLSTAESVGWDVAGENTIVNLPEYNPNKVKSPYAYVLRIENYGRYAAKPRINIEYKNGSFEPTVSISGEPSTSLVYSLDAEGTTWTPYQKPFTLKATTRVRARATSAHSGDLLPSVEAEAAAVKYEWLKAREVDKPEPGIGYKYFEPSEKVNLSSAEQDQATSSGVTDAMTVVRKQRSEKFAFRFEGYVKVEKDALCEFFLLSDDGSKLWIDGVLVVDNGGEHGAIEKGGKVALRKGFHSIRVLYFDGGGGNELTVSWQPEGKVKTPLSEGSLWYTK